MQPPVLKIWRVGHSRFSIEHYLVKYMSLRPLLAAAALALTPVLPLMMAAAPAHAQAVNGYKFLKAVEDRDGDEVTQMLELPGGTLINTRDGSNGKSAIHIVTQRRDLVWMNFMISKGARVDTADNAGNTALTIATDLRFLEGAQLLLDKGANVNLGGPRGETPLIKAVLNRDLPMVRLLVSRGADPDKTDSFSGNSARDLAKRDPRATAILQALDVPKPKTQKPLMGPGLN